LPSFQPVYESVTAARLNRLLRHQLTGIGRGETTFGNHGVFSNCVPPRNVDRDLRDC